METTPGKTATLKHPYNRYTRILLIKRDLFKWIVEIIGVGTRIEVYEDEFDVDE